VDIIVDAQWKTSMTFDLLQSLNALDAHRYMHYVFMLELCTQAGVSMPFSLCSNAQEAWDWRATYRVPNAGMK
jgi:hypothetical protein